MGRLYFVRYNYYVQFNMFKLKLISYREEGRDDSKQLDQMLSILYQPTRQFNYLVNALFLHLFNPQFSTLRYYSTSIPQSSLLNTQYANFTNVAIQTPPTYTETRIQTNIQIPLKQTLQIKHSNEPFLNQFILINVLC